MPTARSGIAAAGIEGRVFVFGGEGPAGTFNQVEAYDAGTNGWSSHARMPTARHGLGAAADLHGATAERRGHTDQNLTNHSGEGAGGLAALA
jgi:N-acetylneuraminic acid mutarotase